MIRGARPGGRWRRRLGERIADELLAELERDGSVSLWWLVAMVEAAADGTYDRGVACRAAMRRLARHGVHLRRPERRP